MMNLRTSCMLVFFTLYLQEGLSREYGAELGADVLLQRIRRQSKPTKSVLKVTDYHVRCTVVSRYAVTTVHSSVWNQLPVTKEAAFEVDLPSSAFISTSPCVLYVSVKQCLLHLRLVITKYPKSTSNGKVYVGQVTERAAARNIYDAAKKQGKTAGLVATKEREIEKFRVAVSVPSGARVSFSLTYEELLPRRLGRYELSLGLRPGQPVQNLSLDVSITERTGISFLKAFPLRTSRLLSNTAQGDAEAPASLSLQYDVELRDLMGEVQVYDGQSSHLEERTDIRATRQNVRDAKDFVKRIIAEGWTNINAALLSPLPSWSTLHPPPPPPPATSHPDVSLWFIFLTDGEATIGVTTGDTPSSATPRKLWAPRLCSASPLETTQTSSS
ncbi:hypothetical protein KUCAC02_012720 [Chaenocephalus aceratus]|uniref:Uncharacterized protein n=1 Tax=Chaenocephalus aceratus TaxID=36190 RepID=A0ACB9XDA5_CHAAC|nr:hypothetical protein KUCAC02_012720 [Chaenocephalus aceratus]